MSFLTSNGLSQSHTRAVQLAGQTTGNFHISSCFVIKCEFTILLCSCCLCSLGYGVGTGLAGLIQVSYWWKDKNLYSGKYVHKINLQPGWMQHHSIWLIISLGFCFYYQRQGHLRAQWPFYKTRLHLGTSPGSPWDTPRSSPSCSATFCISGGLCVLSECQLIVSEGSSQQRPPCPDLLHGITTADVELMSRHQPHGGEMEDTPWDFTFSPFLCTAAASNSQDPLLMQ